MKKYEIEINQAKIRFLEVLERFAYLRYRWIEIRDNDYIQDPETGRMQGSRPSGSSSKSGGKDDKTVEKSVQNGIIKESNTPFFESIEQASEYIKSDRQPKKIFMGSQKKHIQGTKEYNDYVEKMQKIGKFSPSRLTISVSEAQKLIDEFHGTGIIKLNSKGEIISERIVSNKKIVGISVNDLTGKEVETSVFLIKYSKKGTHLIPTYPIKKGS